MTLLQIRPLVGALLAGFAAAACAGAQGTPPAAPPPAAAVPADTPRWTEADVRFMSGMIGHHAQAIAMSRLAPTRAASPAIRTLAERIINAQDDEIATMQQWLRDRGQPVPDPTVMMHHHHGAEGELLPGMITPEEFARLQGAAGEEFDRLFLTYMIRHHQGAVAMVSQLFSTWGAGQDDAVFKFASDVNVDQETEIERMRSMLANLIFEPSAP